MCGRFTLHHAAEDVAGRFAVEQIRLDLKPRFNIAPGTPVAAIVQREDRALEELKWGLVPSWARDPAIGNRLINARAETVAERPAFRTAFARGRCLIPASGYYEWRRSGGRRLPVLLYRRGGEPFVLAGLYERWQTPETDVLRTCAIVTTPPNEAAARVHDRMPAILPEAAAEVWLDRDLRDPEALRAVLRPYPLDDLVAHPVSTRVNRVGVDDPSLIEPVVPPTETDPQLGLGV